LSRTPIREERIQVRVIPFYYVLEPVLDTGWYNAYVIPAQAGIQYRDFLKRLSKTYGIGTTCMWLKLKIRRDIFTATLTLPSPIEGEGDIRDGGHSPSIF